MIKSGFIFWDLDILGNTVTGNYPPASQYMLLVGKNGI